MTPPLPKPSAYMTYAAVRKLCAKNGISGYKFRIIFGQDCPAKKVLPNCKRAVYVRESVLELLGLQ